MGKGERSWFHPVCPESVVLTVQKAINQFCYTFIFGYAKILHPFISKYFSELRKGRTISLRTETAGSDMDF